MAGPKCALLPAIHVFDLARLEDLMPAQASLRSLRELGCETWAKLLAKAHECGDDFSRPFALFYAWAESAVG
jgi:hypothetical protein